MSDISELTTNIHRLSNVLGKVADRALQDNCGYGMSQFKILWMLHQHQEGVLQTTIASWLNQTEAAVSRQIRLLKKEGLIDKQVDPENRRNHIIMLSSDGKKFAEEAMELLVREYAPFFESLGKGECAALSAKLEKIFFTVCTKINN